MKKYWPLALLAFLALLPLTGMSTYWLHIFILVIMWSVIGMAWNLLGGYCGQVSFGHAAFFGLGAYTSGILYQKLGISAWWGLPAQRYRRLGRRACYWLYLPQAAGAVLRPCHSRHGRYSQSDRGKSQLAD